ncbi:MAG: hypothetical protein AAGJ95_04050 [Cyanobacteria bacterium J06554_11]
MANDVGNNENTQDRGEQPVESTAEALQSGGPAKATRLESGYIAQKIQETLSRLQTGGQQQAYAKAMVMSANLGDLNLASPCHSQQIADECRINTYYQREYGLILSKDEAIAFLEDFCTGSIAKAGFKRRHTRLTYEAKFQRPSLKANKRQMLCTYAEWLYQHDYLFEPELPRSLIELLPDGWTKPDGTA